MEYKDGLHLIATLNTKKSSVLLSFSEVQLQLDFLIESENLHKLGEVYHNFKPNGYTAVVCLSESHISIHTWPEFEKVNLDIYLSNFQMVNDDKVQRIFRSLVKFFDAEILQSHEIWR